MTEELLNLERGFWDAVGYGGSYYREHMARHALCVLPAGVLDRETTASTLSHADPWDEFEFTDVQVVDLGDDEAAICYRARASREDDGYTAWISTVYTRLSGRWKLTLHQQTPIQA